MKNLWTKLLKLLNINLQPHQAIPATSYFFTLLLHSYFFPVLMKTSISELPAQWLSFETVWCCVASLVVGIMWKGKFRAAAVKWFAALAIAESACGFSLGMWLAFVQWNVWVYAIFSLLYVSIISLTISRCIMVFKTKLWNEKSRELHDNTQSIIGDIALCVGGVLAIVACPPLKLALVLFGLTCVIDDIGWIVTYLKLRNVLKEEPASKKAEA